jgi:predicted hotdog family 3-hydroxylacyl-ACP dehydratase
MTADDSAQLPGGADFARFAGETADTLLPHERPMVLLARVCEAGSGSAVCRCIVSGDNPFFCAPRGVPSWVGIEFMAQCVAVSAGASARLAGRPLPVGLLLGSTAYRVAIAWFQSDVEYLAHCRVLLEDSRGLGAFDCAITAGDETIATARLTVLEQAGNA